MSTASASESVRWAIGDPGRAASELPAGPPVEPIGHADFAASSASLGPVQIRAGTARGLLHRSTLGPRQDAFALGRTAGGELLAVVCDGVGSLDRSHEAAELASRVLATAGPPWPAAFAEANDRLRAAAGATNGDAARGGMATTAVAVSVRREAGAWVGEVAWVGDSSCWHLQDDGRWAHVAGSPPEAAEDAYHSGSVAPLPSADGACETQPFRLEGGALFLMSDGVANPLKWSDEVQSTLAGWWSRPADPLVFAAQVSFARKSHMDDRTVIGVWFEEPADVDREG